VRRELRLIALGGVPLLQPGDDLCETILHALARSDEELHSGDVLVLAQKIVSKAQGRFVDLDQVTPSPRALELAKVVEKDPRVIELILRESAEVLRARRDVIVVVHRLGFVMANAGIDFSNVDATERDTRVLLLPANPDGECERLRRDLHERAGASVAVIINDSHGRAWRNGTVGVAIGASGIAALLDLRGKPDLFGRVVLHAHRGAAAPRTIGVGGAAGQAGVAGHLTIGDDVVLTAKSATSHDIAPGKVISGIPAFDNRDWLRSTAAFRRLGEMQRTVRELERKLKELETKEQ
jgi:coenzyme F420-0:L-glutamate ligase/coenzyme F420-1:gamma-L-glutamate ligase